MPDKEDTQQFINDKAIIINLIDELMERLEDAVALGMDDENSVIYNDLNLLKDDTDAANSYFVLSEIVHHAKQVEKNIDTWLSSMGRVTGDLNWPDTTPEL